MFMSKARYVVIDGVTRKVKNRYLVIDGVTHKIKKSYRVIDGVTRLFYSGGTNVTYSGAATESTIEIDGVLHNLMTITGAGTLNIDGDEARIWMCGGGSGGGKGSRISGDGVAYAGGGGGGGGYTNCFDATQGEYVVTIGAGGSADNVGGTTSVAKTGGDTASASGGGKPGPLTFNGITFANPKGGIGGSNGANATLYDASGNYSYGSSGTGAGISTYPYGVTSLYAHCGGGGSGATSINGGYGGGTNGGAGKGSAGTRTGGTGGVRGGGKGGNVNSTTAIPADGGNASFYGSAGGGAGGHSTTTRSGGKGYQGVVYVAWPA